MTRGVKALGADGVPRLHLKDAPVDFEFPVDLQSLPLGVVVGAGQTDAARFRLDRLHEPAA